MPFLKNIDENLLESLMNSSEFKAYLSSRRWFADKFLLSNLEFRIIVDYYRRLENLLLTIIKISKEDYEKEYFLPLIYYDELHDILEPSENNKENILTLTENTFTKKIALMVNNKQKLLTLNLIEAEYVLYFWNLMLFEKDITEKFPQLSLKLTLYQEQFQDEVNMKKVRNLIEASIYSNRYEAKLEQLGKGNTTNLLFKLTLINKREKDSKPHSYVLKSYKEYQESVEPSTLYVLSQNDFPNAPKIYGTINVEGKESIGIIQYVSNMGNIGEIYWNELNDMIYDTFSDISADYSEFKENKKSLDVVKSYCEESITISEEIGGYITNLHEALLLPERGYSEEMVESEFYLNNYTHKLNLMISDIQHSMKESSKHSMFYGSPKIQSVFLDAKDILDKFRFNYKKDKIRIQPVHQDLHMEQILYNKSEDGYDFYFMDFEGDPGLPLEARKKGFPTDKDLASFLRSLSYIKFNTMLQFIEKKILEKDEYVVPEEILYSLVFRKAVKKHQEILKIVLDFLNAWELKIMGKILKNCPKSITLINIFTIERILHEVHYEMLFRPKMVLVPLLGLKEVIDNN
ncbi:MAG: hypothetical protein EU541_03450 [Promethearchaeota archaeon]|nr:MAG: hypothetical protein EU541_03450 [Candidatus Lokiarchaeota archaeon]